MTSVEDGLKTEEDTVRAGDSVATEEREKTTVTEEGEVGGEGVGSERRIEVEEENREKPLPLEVHDMIVHNSW